MKAAEAAIATIARQVEAAREAHALAEHELARAKSLSVPRAISQAEVDSAEHQERIAAANLRVQSLAIAWPLSNWNSPRLLS